MNRTILPLAACAFLLGACGDTSDKASGSAEDQALEFAKCMRDQGIDMPDPAVDQDGRMEMRVHPSPGKERQGPDPARMEKAMKACRELAPNGGEPPSEAEQQEMRDEALEFARCMRENGVDMPDPKFEGGGVTMGGPGFDPSSPSFQKAEEACRGKLPGRRGGDVGPSFNSEGAG